VGESHRTRCDSVRSQPHLRSSARYRRSRYQRRKRRSAARIAALELRAGGRLGVFARDTANGPTIATGTQNAFRCAARSSCFWRVLARVDRGSEPLIPYTARDVLDYSPVTASKSAPAG
jgi:hypothetical protein